MARARLAPLHAGQGASQQRAGQGLRLRHQPLAGPHALLQDGRLSLDNDVCEQHLRDIALGRKNYLFAGSHRAARRMAALYSVTRTFAQRGVAPLPYLAAVIQPLAAGCSGDAVDDLLPDRWQAMRAPP